MADLSTQAAEREMAEKLTPRCREVVRMRVEQSMVQEEIAKLLGISQQRVSHYLARARRIFPHLPRVLSSGRHNRIA